MRQVSVLPDLPDLPDLTDLREPPALVQVTRGLAAEPSVSVRDLLPADLLPADLLSADLLPHCAGDSARARQVSARDGQHGALYSFPLVLRERMAERFCASVPIRGDNRRL